MNRNSHIHGIIPPMVTPFDEAGKIVECELRADIRYLLDEARVHGLAVCGSTGEGHTLSADETRAITAAAAEEIAGRVPLITGIIANSTQMAIERGRGVADLGVAALQVTPVHYPFRPDDDAMLRHFDSIAQAVGLPVIIYNVVPWSYLSPAALARIFRACDSVIGVKQSAADLKTLADLMLIYDGDEELRRKDKRILSAVDGLLYPSFELGAHGSVAAILTAEPKWSVELWEAARRGDRQRARQLHRDLLRLWNAIDAPNLPANVKTAMRLRGRPSGKPRPPMPESSAAQEEAIRQAIEAVEPAAVLAYS